MKLVFIIFLSIALAQGNDGCNLEAARSFFEAVYDPVVEYDSQGRVLKGGCPLTAGHIRPKWEEATSVIIGKGKKSFMEYRVPIDVEREIWTVPTGYNESLRSLSERELVLSYKKDNNGESAWGAVIRYRITDNHSKTNGHFTGLVIDVDPNYFYPIALKEYQGGVIVLEEKDLDSYRWTRIARSLPSSGTIEEIWQLTAFHLNQIRDLALNSSYSNKRSIYLIKERGSISHGAYLILSRENSALMSKYVPVMSLPEVRAAISQYKYYPVTNKRY